jgi:hypothetical protein
MRSRDAGSELAAVILAHRPKSVSKISSPAMTRPMAPALVLSLPEQGHLIAGAHPGRARPRARLTAARSMAALKERQMTVEIGRRPARRSSHADPPLSRPTPRATQIGVESRAWPAYFESHWHEIVAWHEGFARTEDVEASSRSAPCHGSGSDRPPQHRSSRASLSASTASPSGRTSTTSISPSISISMTLPGSVSASGRRATHSAASQSMCRRAPVRATAPPLTHIARTPSSSRLWRNTTPVS